VLQGGHSFFAAMGYTNLGVWVWMSEGPAAALEVWRRGIAFAEARGVFHGANWERAESLWTLFELGRWDELLEEAQRVLDWDIQYGRLQTSIFAETWRIYVLLCRGLAVDDARFEEETLARARESGDAQAIAPALGVAAFAARRRGDLATAMTRYEEMVAWSREHRGEYFSLLFYPEAVRTAVAAGRPDLGTTVLEDTETVWLRHQLAIRTARTVLSEHKGDLDRALAGYVEMAEGWRTYGHVVEQAQALLGAGRCLLGLRRRVEAEERLKQAAAAFAALSAQPFVDEVHALLGGTTAVGA